ncbi:MAG: hypothetical protein WC261_13540, partial [Synergistaceae bacterium]
TRETGILDPDPSPNSPQLEKLQILRDAKRCKFPSDIDLFLPLQPFHHCFTTASRRWFFGSFTIVKSQIHRGIIHAAIPPPLQ